MLLIRRSSFQSSKGSSPWELTAAQARLTTSMSSSDIAHAVSRQRCCFPCKALLLLLQTLLREPGCFEGFGTLLKPLSLSNQAVAEREDNPVVVLHLDPARLAAQLSTHASSDPVPAVNPPRQAHMNRVPMAHRRPRRSPRPCRAPGYDLRASRRWARPGSRVEQKRSRRPCRGVRRRPAPDAYSRRSPPTSPTQYLAAEC